MNKTRHYRRFLFLLAMLSAATFGTAQISFDPGDGCLNVIDVSYAQGIGEYGDGAFPQTICTKSSLTSDLA